MSLPDSVLLDAFAARWHFAPDSPLLRLALTHRSAVGGVSAKSNERLEFLGDALLSTWVARLLFDGLASEAEEGALSRARVQIIREETLAAAARRIGLPDLLAIGHGERKERRQNHDSLLSDAFEAIIAAVFREQGEAAMESFLRETLGAALDAVIADPPAPDPKTLLQMRLQAMGRGLPTYRTVEATGIGHDHHFLVEAVAENGETLSRGEGPNKRTAQAEAARAALAALPS